MSATREDGDDGYFVRYIFEENGERKQCDTRMRQKGGAEAARRLIESRV
jgi:hypothetical protein